MATRSQNSDDLLTGNTWADADHRERVLQLARRRGGIIASTGLAGKLISLPDTALATAARTDFAAFLTLLTGSPVAQKSRGRSGKTPLPPPLRAPGATLKGLTSPTGKPTKPSPSPSAERLLYRPIPRKDRTAYLTWMRTGNPGESPEIASKTIIDGGQYGYQGVRGRNSAWTFQPSLTQTYFVSGGIIGGATRSSSAPSEPSWVQPPRPVRSGTTTSTASLGGDSLDGGKGADWLEGNQATVIPSLAAEAPTPYGGVGDDLLKPAKATVTASGRAGRRHLPISSGDSWDWIEDKDGAGHLENVPGPPGAGLTTYKAPTFGNSKTPPAARPSPYSLYAGGKAAKQQILAIRFHRASGSNAAAKTANSTSPSGRARTPRCVPPSTAAAGALHRLGTNPNTPSPTEPKASAKPGLGRPRRKPWATAAWWATTDNRLESGGGATSSGPRQPRRPARQRR